MERGDQVEVLFAGFVVQEDFSLEEILEERDRKIFFERNMRNSRFKSRERPSRVAVGKASQPFEGIFVHRHPCRQSSRWICQCPLHQKNQVFFGERRQDDDTEAREQRAVQLEGGILGRGAHEHDVPRLDEREKRVLLRPVEAMDLVHEEQRASAPALGAGRFLHHVPDLLDAGDDGRKADEPGLGLRGDDPRDRRLAAPGGTPEDERGNLVGRERLREKRAGADEIRRPFHFGEVAGAHPLGKRRVLGHDAPGWPVFSRAFVLEEIARRRGHARGRPFARRSSSPMRRSSAGISGCSFLSFVRISSAFFVSPLSMP